MFEALPDEPIEPMAHPEPEPATGRRGNGVVQRAVMKVLTSANQPVRLRDIHAAVESVGWCVRTSRSGAGPRFERVAYGCYRMMSQT
jgi:hypothetical protein